MPQSSTIKGSKFDILVLWLSPNNTGVWLFFIKTNSKTFLNCAIIDLRSPRTVQGNDLFYNKNYTSTQFLHISRSTVLTI